MFSNNRTYFTSFHLLIIVLVGTGIWAATGFEYKLLFVIFIFVAFVLHIIQSSRLMRAEFQGNDQQYEGMDESKFIGAPHVLPIFFRAYRKLLWRHPSLMKFATETCLVLIALLLTLLSAQLIGGYGILIVLTLYTLTIIKRFIWEIGRHPKYQLRFPFSRNTHTR